MNPVVVLTTPRLQLVGRTRKGTLEMLAGLSPAERREVSPDWLRQLEQSAEQDPWVHGFGIVDRGTGRDIGQCGFKGPPNPVGMVEIAYSISPEEQNRGYATEAAQALAEYALSCDAVEEVWAHTLPNALASIRVLEKCRFQESGEFVDPDDGPVRRFVRRRFRPA